LAPDGVGPAQFTVAELGYPRAVDQEAQATRLS